MLLTPHNKLYLQLTIVVLCIISFFPVFNAGFTNYDDPIFVTGNIYIKKFSFENIKQILSGKPTELYVPLTILSYLLEESLFGEIPFVFHFTNLLLHIINALLFLEILFRLGIKNRNLVSLAILFFALNPLVTESVCWITERKDVLYCFFYFLSILQFLRYQENQQIKNILFCFLFFTLSCLSKAMAVSLPVLFCIYIYHKQSRFEWKKYLIVIPFFINSLAISIISVIRIQGKGEPVPLTSYSFYEKSVLFISEIGYYFLKPFFPFYQQLLITSPHPKSVLSASGIILFAIAGVLLIASMIWIIIRGKSKLLLSLFVSWLVFLLPVLQIVPNTHTYVSERYFYVSILFPVVIVYLLLEKAGMKQQFFQRSLLVIVPLFVVLTFQRSRAWKNSETLFTEELRVDKNNVNAMNNLGHYYNSISDYEKGRVVLRRAVVLDSTHPYCLNNYGLSFASLGRTDSALLYFNKAIGLKSDFVSALNNAGICFVQKNEMEKAFFYFDRAYKIDIENNESLYNMGAWYLKTGDREKARPFIRKSYEMGNKTALKYLND